MKKFYSLAILCALLCWCCDSYSQINGCTDMNASNYDASATDEDGSCQYLCAEMMTSPFIITNQTAFDGGSGLSGGSPSSMTLLAGANNDFAGYIWNLSDEGLGNSEFSIWVDMTVEGGAAGDYPFNIEWRIQNACGGFPCPWFDFNISISEPGTYTLGGVVASGNPSSAGPFNPDGDPFELVAAVANFDGSPIIEDITVSFSNMCVVEATTTDVFGCMDVGAANYNAEATVDDGSCVYDFSFSVDMNCWDGNDGDIENNAPFTDPINLVSVEGPTLGWCGGCAPLADGDGDGIWTGTLQLPLGLFEYKYAINSFAGQEMLIDDVNNGGTCAPITDGIGFANRQIEIMANGSINDTYGTCGTCEPEPMVETYCNTLVQHLGIEAETATAILLTIENTGSNSMKVTIESADNDAVDVLVVNAFDGPITGSPALSPLDTSVPGKICQTLTWAGTPPAEIDLNVLWSKESFGGNWQLGTMNTTVSFDSECTSTGGPGCTDSDAANYDSNASENDGSCVYDMTFNVDMNCETGFTTPYVTGPFTGWCGDCFPMQDLDGDGIYTTVIQFPANTSVEYKYEVDNWTSQEDLVDDMQNGAECAPVTDFSTFANRLVDLTDAPIENNDTYGTCGICEAEPNTESFCFTEVLHLGIPAEVNTAIYLTIENSGPNSMKVTIQSADGDPVDVLIVNAFGGPITGSPALSPLDTSVPGQICQTLTWADTPPSVVELNVLWSKASFGGNWQLSTENTAVDFNNSCEGAPIPGCTDEDANNYNPDATIDSGSCMYDMTFNVDMNCEVGFTTPFVTGPFAGWCGDCYPMEDLDGDGIYTTVISFPANTSVEYKYEVDNWTSQENLIDDMINGAECAPVTDFATFANRLVDLSDAPVTNDDTYGTCGICDDEIFGCTDTEAINYNEEATTDDGSCLYYVTFNVNMNCETGFMTPYVTGPFAGWCGDCYPMEDIDGDGIYTTMIAFPANTTVEYKYEVDNWTSQEDLVDDMVDGADCAPITDFATFANRIVDVTNMDAETSDVYGTCGECDVVPCIQQNFENAPTDLGEDFSDNVTLLSWTETPGATACQVMGGQVGGGMVSLLINGDAPNEYPVNNVHLNDGATYQWRVRCGCSAYPLVATPWSAWSYFTFNQLQPLEETPTLKTVSIFPNPNNGEFNLNVELSHEGPVQVRVYNLLGGVEYATQLIVESKTQTFELSLEDKQSGIYFVDVISNNDKVTTKIVIE
ncbi:MAG: T9SS type A sorting domain-containing protein [Bacteroidota bacterium]